MKIKFLVSLAVLCVILSSSDQSEGRWHDLFNGKDLSGWDTWLGPAYDTITKKRTEIPIGLNNDPSNVFSVAKIDGDNVIRISGQHFGGISTVNEYENYHLQLQFKWGELKWYPRKNNKRDSGIMYYAVGPHGADGGNWLRSQELQIQEGDCGDCWACAGAAYNATARKEGENYIFNKEGEMFSFSNTSSNGRRCIKSVDGEKPSGEWNTIDLYCFNGKCVHVVNGIVNMIIGNSRQIDNGQESPLQKGKIQIQSEGAEVYYRNIRIMPITSLPDFI